MSLPFHIPLNLTWLWFRWRLYRWRSPWRYFWLNWLSLSNPIRCVVYNQKREFWQGQLPPDLSKFEVKSLNWSIEIYFKFQRSGKRADKNHERWGLRKVSARSKYSFTDWQIGRVTRWGFDSWFNFKLWNIQNNDKYWFPIRPQLQGIFKIWNSGAQNLGLSGKLTKIITKLKRKFYF